MIAPRVLYVFREPLASKLEVVATSEVDYKKPRSDRFQHRGNLKKGLWR